MSETIDPITMLRDTFLSKKEVKYSEGNNELIFEETGFKIPKDV